MLIRPTYGTKDKYGTFYVPDPEKATIMRFFNASKYDIAAAGYVFDEVTEEYTKIPELAVREGDIVWGNKDAYHFEKYDMKLSDEFREYAIAHAPTT